MKIVVCIKQVLDTSDIKWTEKNTLQREGADSIINPFDEYAIETALRIKDNLENTTVTVISMGPFQATEILKKAIAMGADEAFLLSDKNFAGSDTLATSRTLAKAIKEKIPNYGLIICGQFATDGDTAQTGPGIAENLDLPQITYVKDILSCDGFSIVAKKEIESGSQILKMQLPGVVCVLKCEYEPREALINGYIKAQEYTVPVCSMEDINLKTEECGFKGSPTYVCKAFRPEQSHLAQIVKKDSVDDYVSFLTEKVQEIGGTDVK